MLERRHGGMRLSNFHTTNFSSKQLSGQTTPRGPKPAFSGTVSLPSHLEARACTLAEVPEAIALCNRVDRELGFSVPAENAPELQRFFEAAVRESKGRIELIREKGSGRLIGVGGIRNGDAIGFPNQAYIFCLHLLTEARGQGAGRWLLQRLLQQAKQARYPGVSLHVQNPVASTLYRSEGFKPAPGSRSEEGSELGFEHLYKAL